MQRRDLLKGIGAAGIGGILAGCIGDIDDGDTEDPGSGGSGDDGGSGGRSLTDQRIETLDAAPSSEDSPDGFEVTSDDDLVTVDGQITASTPCHVATLESVSYDGETGQLSVTVGTENDSEGEACQQVIATLEYQAELEFDGGAPDESDVSVTHDGAGDGGSDNEVGDDSGEDGDY